MSGPDASANAFWPVFQCVASHGVGGGGGGPYGAGGSVKPEEFTCVIETKAELLGSVVTHWKDASLRYVSQVRSSLLSSRPRACSVPDDVGGTEERVLLRGDVLLLLLALPPITESPITTGT